MIISIIGMLIFCIVVAILSLFGVNDFYSHPAFLVGLIFLAILQVICVVRYKLKLCWRSAAFYLCHIGVLLLFCGGGLSYCLAESVNFNIPITTSTTYREIALNNGDTINFGFSIAVAGFKIETTENGGDGQYIADMRIYDNNEEKSYELKINSPVSYKGWKYYLMGYDAGNNDAVALYAKKDPGTWLLLFGFIAMDIGTAALCLQGIELKKKAVSAQ